MEPDVIQTWQELQEARGLHRKATRDRADAGVRLATAMDEVERAGTVVRYIAERFERLMERVE